MIHFIQELKATYVVFSPYFSAKQQLHEVNYEREADSKIPSKFL